MAKSSFKDLLNFEPIAPYADEPPSVDAAKYGKAVSPAQGDDRSAAHKRVSAYKGEYEGGADKVAYGFSNVVTGAQTVVNALPSENGYDSAAIANVLGDVGRSFSFMNYIRRQYSYPGRTEPTVSEMVKDARTMRSLMEETISSINDPMGKYKTREGLGSYTNRDYTNLKANGTANFGIISESHSGLSLQETYRAALTERTNTKRNGTLLYQTGATDNPILKIGASELGKWFGQFSEKYAKDAVFRNKEQCPVVDYYRYISTPYFGLNKSSSPQETLKFAVENLGFSSGYKDWEGFSLGSSHMWGITIKPYVSPNGTGVSLAPKLPVIEVPVWDVVDGQLKCTFKQFDYGKTPPVTQYSFEVGSLRGSHIPLFDGNFNMPLGFEFENKLTLTFVEDEYHSMQKYMAMFINNIYRPTVGLMAPYDLCTWLVSLTAFRPGMNVNYSFNLICVPESYTMSYQGTEGPGVETMNIALSIIGIQSPTHSGATVAPSSRWDAEDTWSKVNWNDVTVKPVNWTQFTDYKDPAHQWGEGSKTPYVPISPDELINDEIDEDALPSVQVVESGGESTMSRRNKSNGGGVRNIKTEPQLKDEIDRQFAEAEKEATSNMLRELREAGAVRDPASDYKNSHPAG